MEVLRGGHGKHLENRSRPEEICKKILTQFPKWKAITERAFEEKGKALPEWPAYVFAPMSAYFPNVFEGKPSLFDPQLEYKLLLINQLAALVPWSLSKSVYRFSEELYEELESAELPKRLPSKILLRLPLWSIYIEIPKKFQKTFVGFFVFLESDQGRDELRILLDSDRYPPVPLILHLDNLSIEDSIARTSWAIQQNIIDSKTNGSRVKNLLDTHGEFQAKELRKVIPLILYLCSDNAEITGLHSHDTYKQIIKDKISFEFPEANNTVIWDVGKKVG